MSSLPGFASSISLKSFSVMIFLPLTSSILSLTCKSDLCTGASEFLMAKILCTSSVVAGAIPMRWIPTVESYLGTTFTSNVSLSLSISMLMPSGEPLSATEMKTSSKSGSETLPILTILSPGLIPASQAGHPGIVRPISGVTKGTPTLKAIINATNAKSVLQATPAMSTAARCHGFLDINSHSSPVFDSSLCSPASFT